jgi:hypothetical protein
LNVQVFKADDIESPHERMRHFEVMVAPNPCFLATSAGKQLESLTSAFRALSLPDDAALELSHP